MKAWRLERMGGALSIEEVLMPQVRPEALSEVERIRLIRDEIQEWLTQNHTDLRQTRKSLTDIADRGAHWDQVKKRGVEFFTGAARSNVDELIKNLQNVGLLLNHRGELESWTGLSEARKGSQWNRVALEKLGQGQCPEDLIAYVRTIVKYLKIQTLAVIAEPGKSATSVLGQEAAPRA